MSQPVVIVIGGPTASGKTKAAIEIATALQTEIINADSRQIYKELEIGVAKPTLEELAQAKHHLVSSISIHQAYTTGDFEKEALRLISEIGQQKKFVIVSGGTGLYIQALLNGMDPLPKISLELRNKVNKMHQDLGTAELAEALKKIDPNASEYVELSNPARVKRAMELVLANNKSLKDLFTGNKIDRPWKTLGYYLNPDREWLYQKINQRVDLMISEGLELEAEALKSFRNLNALQTVGYSEFFDLFDGKYTHIDCVEKIKQHTRNYAKRQLTWFKNQTDFKAVTSENLISTIFADLKSNGYSIYE
jgi:tRNA dimethylallyltransferase